MTTNWMQALAGHYEQRRSAEPRRTLAVVLDVDGTVLDGRHLLLDTLRAFDEAHGTHCAEGLAPEQLNVHESRLPRLLEQLGEPPSRCRQILAFHRRYRWSTPALLRAHRPYRGVLEVIRWFQLQPRTVVAINTGRPEALRLETLHALNTLGARFRVHFPSELLYMNPREDGEAVAEAKVRGLARLREAGYGIAAVVDNEPDNLAAMCRAHADEDILPLHAATIFRSKRLHSPRGTVRGTTYDITSLINARRMPRHVQFVWERMDREGELHRFLASEIRWGDAGLCPPDAGARRERAHLTALMQTLARCGRRLRLGVNTMAAVEWLAASARATGLSTDALWVTARLEDLGEEGLARAATAMPGAVLEVDGGFLLPMAKGMPDQAAEAVERLRRRGVNRFGLPWQPEALPAALDLLDRLGAEAHLGGTPDLESFLRASLLQPRSIGTRFDFPDWAAARGRPRSREWRRVHA